MFRNGNYYKKKKKQFKFARKWGKGKTEEKSILASFF